MAEDTIDRLSIEIDASARKANSAIDNLIGKLDKLSGSLSMVDTGGLRNVASGINDITRAVNGFKNSGVVTQDFTRIASGLSRLSTVNVQGISNTSRAISTLAVNLNNLSHISFDSQGIANMANALAQLGRKTVTQAASNIPLLTSSLKSMVTELSGVGSINFDFTNFAELTSSISKLGGKASTNAIPNIKALGQAITELMTTLSQAPRVSQNLIDMTNALANLASKGSRVSSASNAMKSGFTGLGNSMKTLKSHTFSIVSAIGKLYAKYWMIIRSMGVFKKAINISSDLTEVQNIVDATFGDFQYKLNEMAKTSIKDYGISELTTKKISSRFQAMGTAMGFAQGKMSDMSIELTKLAADMASFYNVSQEDVAEDLSAVFTGQTRPLRQYGLDLSQATLKEWALKNGMDANIQSMTQAEKTLLRYNYVLANTTAAQGDFRRTAGTWANQVRILSQSFQALGAIVGETLINAFKPFVAALNTVMEKVIAFARTVANALGAIFGWTIEISEGGALVEDFEAAEDSSGGTADNLGEAAKNAKKLKNFMLGFDELHVLDTNTSDSGAGGGAGGAGGGATDAAEANLVRTESILDKYQSDIDSLFKLGKYISDTLTNTLWGIDWNRVYEGAGGFGEGLASFLNGLINPRLFYAVGRTIANALNTALEFLNSFGYTFDWTDFGTSIAAGINGFFTNFNFALAADTFNVWASGVLDTLIAALKGVRWRLIGEQIGTFIAGIDWLGVLKQVGEAIKEAFKAVFEMAVGFIDTAAFETALVAAFGLMKFTIVGDIIGGAISKAIVGGIAGKLGVEVAKNATLSTVLTTALSSKFTALGASISSTLIPIGTKIAAIISGPWGIAIAAAVAGIILIFANWEDIKPYIDKVGKWFADMSNNIDSIMGGLIDSLIKWGANAVNTLVSAAEKIFTGVGRWFKNLSDSIDNTFGRILDGFIKWGVNASNTLSGWLTKMSGDVVGCFGTIASSCETLFKAISGIIDGLKTGFKGLIEFITGVFSGDWRKAWEGVKDIFRGVFNGLISIAEGVVNTIIKGLNRLIGGLDGLVSKAGDIIGIDVRIPKISEVKLSRFELGGFPETGELFVANENGPEFVGKMGSQTAVANNDQIVMAIKQGVYEAMMTATANQTTQPIEVRSIVELDGEAIYDNQQKVSARRGYDFNMGAFAR